VASYTSYTRYSTLHLSYCPPRIHHPLLLTHPPHLPALFLTSRRTHSQAVGHAVGHIFFDITTILLPLLPLSHTSSFMGYHRTTSINITGHTLRIMRERVKTRILRITQSLVTQQHELVSLYSATVRRVRTEARHFDGGCSFGCAGGGGSSLEGKLLVVFCCSVLQCVAV